MQLKDSNKLFLSILIEEKGKLLVDTVEEFKFIAAKVNTDRPITKKEYDLLVSVGNDKKSGFTFVQTLDLILATYGIYNIHSGYDYLNNLIKLNHEGKFKAFPTTEIYLNGLEKGSTSEFFKAMLNNSTVGALGTVTAAASGIWFIVTTLKKHSLNKMLEKAKTLIKK
jgi:hypothetical protein